MPLASRRLLLITASSPEIRWVRIPGTSYSIPDLEERED
jgi:hypothetical protein